MVVYGKKSRTIKDLERRLELEEDYSSSLMQQLNALHTKLLLVTRSYSVFLYEGAQGALTPGVLSCSVQDGRMHIAVSLSGENRKEVLFAAYHLETNKPYVYTLTCNVGNQLHYFYAVQFYSKDKFDENFFVFQDMFAMQSFLKIMS
tara:strand:+ start:7546 stop:7986 length:441 start_codon:yes stop_codon:yes gene_type:complete